jgi:hypothetical protein
MTSQNENSKPDFKTSREFGLEILLPSLENGREIQLAGNFIPKYIFELISQMASSPEDINGYLNLWLLVPRKFIDRPDAISTVVEIVHKNAETKAEAVDFIENCLFLIENQALGFNVGFYKNDAPKTALTQAVVFDRDELDAFWALSDNKPGFLDEELKIYAALAADEYIDARKIFSFILSLANNSDSRIEMYKGGEVIGWLGFASDWALEHVDVDEVVADALESIEVVNPEYESEDGSDEDDIEDIIFSESSDANSKFDILDRSKIQIYESVKTFLLDLDEFKSEQDYTYFGDDDAEAEALDSIKYCDTIWGRLDLDLDDFDGYHHIPPLYNQEEIAAAGLKTAVCICGTLFIRAHGCYQVTW